MAAVRSPTQPSLEMYIMPRRSFVWSVALTLAICAPSEGAAQSSELGQFVDSIASEYLEAGTLAGMSVGVVQGSDTLLMRSYGHADLEWDVAMPQNAIFQIGSVTKQFTAAAALMLWEQGKLDLDADVTEYLPDFDTQGHAVSVRRLFDHTSGIKGYTEMPVFGGLSVQSLPRDTLLTLVEAEPFDFEPGTAEIYNNSAFFMLGLIIEKISGQSYEEFLEEHVFPKADMDDSSYCSNSTILENRARGYQSSPDGLQRAPYLNHTWPYAAGSLCSTVGDLISWNRALHGGRVLGDEAYQLLITPEPLLDGTMLRYAKGIARFTGPGGRMIEHAGGINGFLSESRYYTDHDATVVVLVNTTGPVGPGRIADAIGSHLFGDGADPVAATYSGDLGAFAGEYSGASRGRELTARVSVNDDGQLTIRTGGRAQTVEFLDGTTFFRGTDRYTFDMEDGEPVRLRTDQVYAYYMLDAGELGEIEEVSVSEAVMAGHVGKYDLAELALVAEVTLADSMLFIQVTGQPKVPMFADGDNEYHLEIVEASMTFVVEDGITVAMILHQGGADIRAVRVEG
jgi:CubicO group peptidase (beta-lactamase class C family)